MKNLPWLTFLFTTLLALWFGCKSQPVNQPVRLSQVGTAKLWRSGQPNTLQQWSYLRSIGITDVVKLNTERGDGLGEELGIVVHRYPITIVQQTVGPAKPQLDAALAEVITLLNQGRGVLVHCEEGRNRTGALIYAYRIKACKWTRAEAKAEYDRFGGQSSLPAIRKYVDDYE